MSLLTRPEETFSNMCKTSSKIITQSNPEEEKYRYIQDIDNGILRGKLRYIINN